MNRFALVFGLAAAFLTPCLHAQTEQEPPYLTPGDEPGQVDVKWLSVQDRTYFVQVSLDLIRWLYVPYIEFGNGEHLAMTFPKLRMVRSSIAFNILTLPFPAAIRTMLTSMVMAFPTSRKSLHSAPIL